MPPEFLNVEVEKQIDSILGNPLKLIPEDGNLTDTNAISVLIEFNISNPMLRGLLTEIAAKITQWVSIYFQRQPNNLCPACLILDHNELQCADKAKDVQAMGITFSNLVKILVKSLIQDNLILSIRKVNKY